MSRWNNSNNYYGFPQYVTAAQRKLQTQQKIKKLSAKGEKLSPVVIEGRTIARTFWGKAWCSNIESYHDYENRLPRGRSYVRSGAVIDLQIEKGRISAKVMGSELYEIDIAIKELPSDKWNKIIVECTGKIASLIDLIQGKLSPEIIALLCRKDEGLFPSPKEIILNCNCPDWADLCKHLAAVMYGIGARLDSQPELFFLLRGVDQNELFSSGLTDNLVGDDTGSDIDAGDLGGIFGIELDDLDDIAETAPVTEKRKVVTKKTAAKSAVSGKSKVPAIKKTPATKKAAKAPGKTLKAKKTKPGVSPLKKSTEKSKSNKK